MYYPYYTLSSMLLRVQIMKENYAGDVISDNIIILCRRNIVKNTYNIWIRIPRLQILFIARYVRCILQIINNIINDFGLKSDNFAVLNGIQ